MTTINLTERLTIYQRIVAHFSQLYPLYERAGIRYPVVVYPAYADQIQDVDSVLGTLDTTVEDPEDFAFYDNTHLQTLQQSGRRLENRVTYSFARLHTNPLRMDARLGNYFDMMATCDALEREARAYFRDQPPPENESPLVNRSHLHQMISPQQALTNGRGRSGTIGVATLIVFNHDGDYQAVLARRSQHTATEPLFYHVQPAFVFQPVSVDSAQAEWQVAYHIYRELLEELFNVPEDQFYDDITEQPQIRSLLTAAQATLYLTGISLNILTQRPEICTLLLIHDPNWYTQIVGRPTGWETERNSTVFAPITSDAALLAALPEDVRHQLYANMTPLGSAALWLGVDCAREILGQ
jgi:hypothetical protein